MAEVKTVTVILPGSGQRYDLEIHPGMTAGNLLSQLGTEGKLREYNSDQFFEDNQDLFPLVSDGEKLEAVPRTPVGVN